MTSFSLERFERLAYSRQHEPAAVWLTELLVSIERDKGALRVAGDSSSEPSEELLTRTAAAISALVADPGFRLSRKGWLGLLQHHRWLSALFAGSAFRNADHILRSLSVGAGDTAGMLQAPGALTLAEADLPKFLLFYFLESELDLDLDGLWSRNKELAASLCFALLSVIFLGSFAVHRRRENILPWLTARLDQAEDAAALPLALLPDIYMQCSYADRPDKHDLKRPLNALVRRLLAMERLDAPARRMRPDAPEQKPVLLVVAEIFHARHPIYRTHSRSIEAARALFTVIGLGFGTTVDAAGRASFDEFIEIRPDNLFRQIAAIRRTVEELQPDVLYMPSVGMSHLTIFLSNLRLAPLQVMGLGHPATSHAAHIDYVIVEEDFVGDPSCFSEELLLLPGDGMPYRPHADTGAIIAANPRLREAEHPDQARYGQGVVHVAVAATAMKINPRFLKACAEIAGRAASQVRFHFLVGRAVGVMLPPIRQTIGQQLGASATVYPQQAYPDYMRVIAGCDMFLNPFPFGNTNSIVDTVSGGLVGICKIGREVHEQIDAALFRRLGFRDWMVADTVQAYVDAAVRLADGHEERRALREQLAGPDRARKLFAGRPEALGQILRDTLALRRS